MAAWQVLVQTEKNIFSDNQAAAGGAYHTYDVGTGANPTNSLRNNSFVRNAATNDATWYLAYNSNIYNNLVAFNQATGGAPNRNIFLNQEDTIINFNNFFGNTSTYEIFNNLLCIPTGYRRHLQLVGHRGAGGHRGPDL